MNAITKLENKRAESEKLNKEIEELEKEVKKFELIPDDQKLATIIHDKMCRWNHTDGCDWFYGDWKNPRDTRKDYLAKAKKILDNVDYETAKTVIRYI